MQFKLLSLAALASLTSAQMMGLTASVANMTDLSNLTTYLRLLPEVTSYLEQLTNVTVLAPSDEAFSKLMDDSGSQMIDAIQGNDTELIASLFAYHVLNGTHYASSITNESAFIPTALVNSRFSNVSGGQRVRAVMAGNQTYFFSGLLQNSSVTSADNNYTGGVIHVIDTFLTLPVNISDTAVAANLTAAAGALNDTGLVDAVDSMRNVTCFIPNNAAFQSIGSALENITMEDLAGVLQYHVVPNTLGYSSALTNTTLTTLAGTNVTITLEDDRVFVNSVEVLIPDVLVANGVVHIIDGVLNPANATATPDATATTREPAFSGASSASEVPYTSGVSTPSSAIANPTEAAASSSSSGIAQPMKTGAVGAAALFGGAAAIMMNL